MLAAARRDEGRPGQAQKQGKSTPHVPMVLHPSPIDGSASLFEQQRQLASAKALAIPDLKADGCDVDGLYIPGS
jgi:hypothetical protein